MAPVPPPPSLTSKNSREKGKVENPANSSTECGAVMSDRRDTHSCLNAFQDCVAQTKTHSPQQKVELLTTIGSQGNVGILIYVITRPEHLVSACYKVKTRPENFVSYFCDVSASLLGESSGSTNPLGEKSALAFRVDN